MPIESGSRRPLSGVSKGNRFGTLASLEVYVFFADVIGKASPDFLQPDFRGVWRDSILELVRYTDNDSNCFRWQRTNSGLFQV